MSIQMEAITHWKPQVIPEPLKSILPHTIPRTCMVMEYPVPSNQQRIILISDLHLGRVMPISSSISGFLTHFKILLEQTHPNIIFCLGDIFQLSRFNSENDYCSFLPN